MYSKKYKFNLLHIIASIIVAFMLNQSCYAENLLINPGAETGDITGWTPEPENFWVANANGMPPHDGNYVFWPGSGSLEYGTLSQDIDISGSANSIDSGNSYFHLSAWMVNWDQYPHDRATLSIIALNEAGSQLAYFSRSHRSPTYGFYLIESQVPPGSRTLKVQLIATRYVGSDNDGYFDTISLEVDEVVPSTIVSLSSDSDADTLAIGTTLQLDATTTGGADNNYSWSSSFEAVATVDSNGLVSAHTSGRVTIQAQGDQTQTIGSMELTVYAANDVIFEKPVSNETLVSRSAAMITWDIEGTLSSGTLSYSTTGGSSWTTITSIADLTVGEYSWDVIETTVPLNDCMLKMTWDDGESFSSTFRIDPVSNNVAATMVPIYYLLGL